MGEAMVRAAKEELVSETLPEVPDELEHIESGIESHILVPDDLIPNNTKLPLILYRQVLALEGQSREPERAFEALFASNGWCGSWVNGIYDFHHYHSTAHEVLGIAKGFARVQFGGPNGPIAELSAGDAVAIPAGVGHCLLEGKDFVVVGAYPEGQDWDLCRATKADRVKALENIPWVPLPTFDPVFGPSGPVLDRWVD
jgi:uncharacterized protein YjlB